MYLLVIKSEDNGFRLHHKIHITETNLVLICIVQAMAPNFEQGGPDLGEICDRKLRLQMQLRAAVESIQWTYSVFWKLDRGLLVWSDGFYNGGVKRSDTVQDSMEMTPEELCVERTVQLRELFESLSGKGRNPRQLCAALSPGDLTDTEWFYLISMSYQFQTAVGLPGQALAKGRPIWLCNASESNGKAFKRCLLAKTVVCFPFTEGVLEFGVTELVHEDPALVEQIASFFVELSQPSP
eukprot:Gb_32249 [translate_table: standard]